MDARSCRPAFSGQSGVRVSKWVTRYRIDGALGLRDRSSRPHRCPNQTRKKMQWRIVMLPVTRVLECTESGITRMCHAQRSPSSACPVSGAVGLTPCCGSSRYAGRLVACGCVCVEEGGLVRS
ncbi:MAG: hypothetical protein B5766_10235 [Candidatus Lumbricidophila eiseniae]|uniref:DNA-binding domain-containing protein n=1 Tax=Candidatus Lumbricidiphila eiseniae TaxID=1969409 RepID=A0A2A6FNU8_9MICO|nr:MAG: hypothetical protein B5766_10235 [Candidatus Lumbricidophila eiseniae]